MIIDAGLGDKENAEVPRHLRRRSHPVARVTLAEAGLAPEDIDIVLATHLHFDHAGGFTMPRRRRTGFARVPARAVHRPPRRVGGRDCTRTRATGPATWPTTSLPLAEAGVLQLVDDDATIMPGVRVRRTGGHTMHHQIVLIESEGRTAAFVADLIPTTAHLPDAWMMGYDLYPMDTLAAKQQFVAGSDREGDAGVLRARPDGCGRLSARRRTGSAASSRRWHEHQTLLTRPAHEL